MDSSTLLWVTEILAIEELNLPVLLDESDDGRCVVVERPAVIGSEDEFVLLYD